MGISFSSTANKVSGSFEGNVHLLEVIKGKTAISPGRNDSSCTHRSYSRNAKKKFKWGIHNLNGKFVDVGERPCKLRVNLKIEPRGFWRNKFIGGKCVIAHQPVSLIEPVFTS